MALLCLQALAKSFRSGGEEIRVLAGVELEMEQGTSVVITGESGSGKTTLLNLVAGLDSPTAGRVLIDGTEVTALDEAALAAFRGRTLGFIFQFHYLLRDFTALENVLMPAWITGRRGAGAARRALSLLEEVGLGSRAGRYPSELSGGERQRVAVARALVNDPRLVVADEPTGNLDERNSATVRDLLFDLVRRHGKTLLVATHDPRLAARGDRTLRLAGGVLSAA
jgi:lipoprotein-releasing system ATP-binding protein